MSLQKLILLGTGPSTGLPNVACITQSEPTCKVCLSSLDKNGEKNIRLNISTLIQILDDQGIIRNILIDCGKTFYASTINHFKAHNINRIDAVILTHGHADAMFGLDDLRPWCKQAKNSTIPIYLDQSTFNVCSSVFPYLIDTSKATGGGEVATLKFEIIQPNIPFKVEGLEFLPFQVEHGYHSNGDVYHCLGFKFGNVAYISDTSKIPQEVIELTKHSKLLILDLLKDEPYSSHLGLKDMLDYALKIQAELTLTVGMAHQFDHYQLEQHMQDLSLKHQIDIRPGHDGLELDLSDLSFKSNHQPNNRQVIFSGIQPTGIPHLGNYFGALINWVKIQSTIKNENILIFSIVDLHALTKNSIKNSFQLRTRVLDITAILLAIGIDPNRSILYRQSRVKQHSELSWILACNTNFNRLSNMSQWKNKRNQLIQSTSNESDISDMGFFSYPVLQAADILLFKSNQVPVGEDQREHLKLTRDIATNFNSTFQTDLFPLPLDLYTPAGRIQSLTHPLEKMSKSAGTDESKIFLTDPPNQIQSKIMNSTADDIMPLTFDPITRPGIANLLIILGQITNEIPERILNRLGNQCHLNELKIEVSKKLIEHLLPIQKKFKQFRIDENYLEEILEKGSKEANFLAKITMNEVNNIIGLDTS